MRLGKIVAHKNTDILAIQVVSNYYNAMILQQRNSLSSCPPPSIISAVVAGGTYSIDDQIIGTFKNNE